MIILVKTWSNPKSFKVLPICFEYWRLFGDQENDYTCTTIPKFIMSRNVNKAKQKWIFFSWNRLKVRYDDKSTVGVKEMLGCCPQIFWRICRLKLPPPSEVALNASFCLSLAGALRCQAALALSNLWSERDDIYHKFIRDFLDFIKPRPKLSPKKSLFH